MTLISRLKTKLTFENPSYLNHSLLELGVLENILIKGVSLEPNKGIKIKYTCFQKWKTLAFYKKKNVHQIGTYKDANCNETYKDAHCNGTFTEVTSFMCSLHDGGWNQNQSNGIQ